MQPVAGTARLRRAAAPQEPGPSPLAASEEVAGVRLRVVEVASTRELWHREVFPRAIVYRQGEFTMREPPLPLWTNTWLQDLRWSPDGHYLSFTLYDDPTHEPAIPTVHLIDARTWREVEMIPNAVNAFVIPAAEGGAGG